MPIPRKKDFQIWNVWTRKELSNRAFSKILSVTSDEDSFPNDIEQHAKIYIDTLKNIAVNERWKKRKDYTVYQWLESQPGFNRALFLAFGEKRLEAPLLKWEEICSKHLTAISNSKTSSSAKQKINYAADNLRGHFWWESYIIRALDEYLHVDHDEIFLASLKMENNCRNILKLIHEIKPAIEADSLACADDLKKVIKKIEFWDKSLQPHGLLKNRNNKFKAEHRFIERIYSANLRFFKTAKPQVIAELMTLECFEKQFDLRHISRLCSTIKMTRSVGKSQTPVMASDLG